MTCERAQEEILESFIEPRPADVQATLNVHLESCAACAAFAEKQRRLDRQLTNVLVSPQLTERLRAAVRERTRHQRRTFWSDLLPDLVHFASCAIVTVIVVLWSPLSTPVALLLAAAGTLLTHVVLTAAHDSLDAAEESAT